jgi:hypothetical protein
MCPHLVHTIGFPDVLVDYIEHLKFRGESELAVSKAHWRRARERERERERASRERERERERERKVQPPFNINYVCT